jgi:hypothetical protein
MEPAAHLSFADLEALGDFAELHAARVAGTTINEGYALEHDSCLRG